MRTRPLAVLLVTVVLALLPHAAAASCRQECQPAIARCFGAGYRRAACRRLLVKACRHFGRAACDLAFLPTTTTTAPPSSPTTTTTLPPPPPVCGGQLLILATDGTYLGCITCSEFSSDSIFNSYGSYGSPYSATSIHNHYGAYGSPYSALSACNPYGVTPPAVVDESGCFVTRLSLNPYVPDSVCGVLGSAALCQDLTILCGS